MCSSNSSCGCGLLFNFVCVFELILLLVVVRLLWSEECKLRINYGVCVTNQDTHCTNNKPFATIMQMIRRSDGE